MHAFWSPHRRLPTQPARVNRDNPLTNGLGFLWVAGSGIITNVLSGQPLSAAGAPGIVAENGGLAATLNGTSTRIFSDVPAVSAQGQYSLLVFARRGSGGGVRCYLSFGNPATQETAAIRRSGTGSAAQFNHTNAGGSGANATMLSGTASGEFLRLAGVSYSATSRTGYAIDEAGAQTTGTNTANRTLTASQVNIVCRMNAGTPVEFADGAVLVAAIWPTRALAADDVWALLREPQQLFEPVRIWVPGGNLTLTAADQFPKQRRGETYDFGLGPDPAIAVPCRVFFNRS